MAEVDIWLVVGARRWARIIIEELCAALPPGAPVQLQASRDDADLQTWWHASPYVRQITIVDAPMPCRHPTVGVALIANSAYLHPSAIEASLAAGYHVACEKPLAFSRHEAQRLLDAAAAAGLRLFATNTYLFADYLRVFTRDWLVDRRYSEIHLIWSDAVVETRYGLAKGYDSGVPVIHDVLPHVACIVLATHGEIKLVASELVTRRGGSEVAVRFECADVTLLATLSRNSKQRVRSARFCSSNDTLTIDFSVEPGSVSIGETQTRSADPAWQSKRKPIAEMLHSLQVYFGGGAMDDRLRPQASLLGNELTDSVADSYVRQQIEFLEQQAGNRSPVRSADSAYAAKEANSIAQRALPFLPPDSPLKQLANPVRVF